MASRHSKVRIIATYGDVSTKYKYMIQGMPEIIIEAHKEVIIICHVSPKYKHMKQAMPETIIAVQISMKNNLQRVPPLQILNR